MQKTTRVTSALLTALCCINLAAPCLADTVNSYSNTGAPPSDRALRVERPQPASKYRGRAVALAAPCAVLRGAKTIYSFDESAFQTLPARIASVTNFDEAQQKWVSRNVRLSHIIEREARGQGIDPLIVEIIIGHESAFSQTAQSNVGACGFMQLMPDTAAGLGVTDINDPDQNISAGTRYFAEQYRRFGDLHLALAAYNAGPNSVAAYGGVPPYDETINYASSIAQEYESRRKKR